jgi:phospholipase A-2-activating protein
MSTENTFTAARHFLEKNDLPLTYIDQVAQFIEKNTGAVNLGGNDNSVDPYTGKLTLEC